MVAPVTASTARVCPSTMAAGMRSSAGSLMPAVSLWDSTSTAWMASSVTVTATVTGPPLPLAWAS